MQTEKINLTQYSHGAGCGCKIAPAVLEEILKTNETAAHFPSLLVGNDSKDDAAVYDLGNGSSLISTTDFFMPIVDDAFDFGRIAAANSISDVYAMGGTPLMAIAILGWPVETLPASLAQQVLDGARAVCKEANIPLAGGHSIDSKEPFFGLAVNGLVNNQQLKQNNTAREGDILLITKPIGVGILSTAQKRKVLQPEHDGIAVKWMTQLNKAGALLSSLPGVHAMTDVTGFGLLGHLIEMAEGSGLSAELNYATIPVIEEAKTYLAQRIVPDATYRNWNSYSTKVGFETGVNVMEAFNLLPDPQTNGGLLIAATEDAVEEIQKINGDAVIIGKFIPAGEKLIKILA
ncbi:selenide, water dikinase SelD [Lacibacter sp. MH-610]|uniref:selenide, water dikinase SelD n=1 Tax=Lacibacter sp. MH-610 TaxID=3020883 RepID=UPI0038928D39